MSSKPKSYVPISKIKNALRRIHLHDKQREKAKARAKIDAALFKCESKDCKIALYEGSSVKNYLKMCDKYKDIYEVHRAKIEADHEVEVIDVKKGFCDWNTYIERLYCSAEGYNMLCRECHEKRTKEQLEQRTKNGSLKRK